MQKERNERDNKTSEICITEDDLVRLFRPKLMRMLMRLTRDPSIAEDLAQETLIIVLEKLREDKIRDHGLLASYVLNTGKFHFLGWTRRRGNQVRLIENCDHIAAESATVEDEIFAEQQKILLRSAIDKLGAPRDRAILTRHYVDDCSKSEICEEMDLSNQQFDCVVSRARIRLQNEIETADCL